MGQPLTPLCYYWVDLGPVYGARMAKTRPALLLSPTALNNVLATVVVVPLTTTIRPYPSRFETTLNGVRASVCLDQIQTVPKNALSPRKIRRASRGEARRVEEVLRRIYLSSSS